MANPFEKRATEYLRDDEAGFLSLISPEPLRSYFQVEAGPRHWHAGKRKDHDGNAARSPDG
jgi:hypothetical protein